MGMGSVGLMMLQLLKLIPVESSLGFAARPARARETTGRGPCAAWRRPRARESDPRTHRRPQADLVVFTAGGGKVFQKSFDWIRDGGALNLFASLSDRPTEVSLDALYHHEITVFSSYSPSPQDLIEAHRLICEAKVQVEPLVTHHLGLHEIKAGIEAMIGFQALKVVIHP